MKENPMTQMKAVLLAMLLQASLASAQSATPEVLVVDAPASVTTCEVEQSVDNGVTWVKLAPQITPAGTPRVCTASLTPPAGRTLYRWAYFSGTTRTLRTDAGVYLCVGLTDCPLAPSNVGVR